MGRLARRNPCSSDGRKPRAYVALMRLWRQVGTFQGDRAAFDRWLATYTLQPAVRERLELLWAQRYPEMVA